MEKLGKPYDLRCTRGTEERHVEIKGTTGAPTSVELTINEVLHARDTNNTVDLYVVSDIKVDTHTDPYTATGNTVTHYHDWKPAEEDPRPRKYGYGPPHNTSDSHEAENGATPRPHARTPPGPPLAAHSRERNPNCPQCNAP
ncbi:protein NO VEIN domain-containing protein [Streptomyces humi]